MVARITPAEVPQQRLGTALQALGEIINEGIIAQAADQIQAIKRDNSPTAGLRAISWLMEYSRMEPDKCVETLRRLQAKSPNLCYVLLTDKTTSLFAHLGNAIEQTQDVELMRFRAGPPPVQSVARQPVAGGQMPPEPGIGPRGGR